MYLSLEGVNIEENKRSNDNDVTGCSRYMTAPPLESESESTVSETPTTPTTKKRKLPSWMMEAAPASTSKTTTGKKATAKSNKSNYSQIQ